jgi:hypothetical protein
MWFFVCLPVNKQKTTLINVNFILVNKQKATLINVNFILVNKQKTTLINVKFRFKLHDFRLSIVRDKSNHRCETRLFLREYS